MQADWLASPSSLGRIGVPFVSHIASLQVGDTFAGVDAEARGAHILNAVLTLAKEGRGESPLWCGSPICLAQLFFALQLRTAQNNPTNIPLQMSATLPSIVDIDETAFPAREIMEAGFEADTFDVERATCGLINFEKARQRVLSIPELSWKRLRALIVRGDVDGLLAALQISVEGNHADKEKERVKQPLQVRVKHAELPDRAGKHNLTVADLLRLAEPIHCGNCPVRVENSNYLPEPLAWRSGRYRLEVMR